MLLRCLLVCILTLGCLPIATVQAEVEGQTVRTITLAETPKAVALSPSGRNYFVLGAEKLYLYSIDGQQLGAIEVGKDVTAVTAQSDNLVLLQREGKKTLEYLNLSVVQELDTSDAPVRGNLDAPVSIVVFDDFECPYCARLAPTLEQVLEKNPQNVRLVFKNFPLGMHRNARPAAIAAEAAGRQGKFWEMHDQLFANYNKLSGDKIESIARDLKLDMEQFNKDRKDKKVQASITRDQQQGNALGVRGTPTIYVNGRLLRDRSPQGFQRAIDAELARQKK